MKQPILISLHSIYMLVQGLTFSLLSNRPVGLLQIIFTSPDFAFTSPDQPTFPEKKIKSKQSDGFFI